MKYLIDEYKKEWQFFKKEMKISFPMLLIGFIALIIISHFAVSAFLKSDSNALYSVSKLINESMKGIDLSNDAQGVSIIKLFFNNAKVCLIAVSVGIVPFLFVTAIFYFFNGTLVGIVTAFSSAVANFGLSFYLAALLPHGIFEIPAIIYACALGFYLCKETTKVILRKSDKPFGAAVIETLRSYVLVILPLLFIAAIIEATLTMNIAMRFI